MVFSAIIVNYRTAKLTSDCLKSVFEHSSSGELELIVVDNASGDGSFEILDKEFGSRIKLIRSLKNVGFGAANNLGAKEASGDILFFLNSDTLIDSDVFSSLARSLIDEKTGIAAPRLVLPDGRRQPYAGGKFPDLPSLLLRKTSTDIDDAEKEWVSGAALAIKKQVFERIGGFDERFFMYFEDMDLCWRVISAGYAVLIRPDCRVIHLGGRSLEGDNSTRRKYYDRSQDLFYAKHHSLLAAATVKIVRFFYRIFK